MKLTYQQELTRRKQIADNPFTTKDLQHSYTALMGYQTTLLNLDLLPQNKEGVSEFTDKYTHLFYEVIKMSGVAIENYYLSNDYLNMQPIAENSHRSFSNPDFKKYENELAKMQYQFLVFQFGQKDAECLVNEWAITEELLMEFRKSLLGKEYHIEKEFNFSELPELKIENWETTITEIPKGREIAVLPF